MTHGPETKSDYVVVRDFARAVIVWSCDLLRAAEKSDDWTRESGIDHLVAADSPRRPSLV